MGRLIVLAIGWVFVILILKFFSHDVVLAGALCFIIGNLTGFTEGLVSADEGR